LPRRQLGGRIGEAGRCVALAPLHFKTNPRQAWHGRVQDCGGHEAVEWGDGGAGYGNPLRDLGDGLPLGAQGMNDRDYRCPTIGIIFELSHLGGEVRLKQSASRFEYSVVKKGGLEQASRGAKTAKLTRKSARTFPDRFTQCFNKWDVFIESPRNLCDRFLKHSTGEPGPFKEFPFQLRRIVYLYSHIVSINSFVRC
jgi:hypothetical protein